MIVASPGTRIEALARDLARHRPFRIPRARGFVYAAVAIAVAPTEDDLRVLLIGRPRRPGDRWSGDIAFPGGLASEGDDSGLVTARREAKEEVGLELGEPLGTLSDRFTLAPGRAVPMRIRSFVFPVRGDEPLVPDAREVEAIYRPTLDEIAHAEVADVERRYGPFRHRFVAKAFGDHRLWGLTASLVDELRRRALRGARLS